MGLLQGHERAVKYAIRKLPNEYSKYIKTIVNKYIDYSNKSLLKGYPAKYPSQLGYSKLFFVRDLIGSDLETPKTGYSIRLDGNQYLTILFQKNWLDKYEYTYQPTSKMMDRITEILNSNDVINLKNNDSTNQYKASYY